MGKLVILGVVIYCLSLGLDFRNHALAFNDDSRLDLFLPKQNKRTCKNGRQITNDSKSSRFSCGFIEAFVDSRGYLYKNNKQVSSKVILDFKLSRSGKLFYRSKSDSKLYNEKGLLRSGTSSVLVYLVSSNGKVVYLSKDRQVYKNGKSLNSGLSKVPLIKKYGIVINPAISIYGTAFYITDDKNLYKEGQKINPHTAQVQRYELDHKDNVYYVGTDRRLYKNGRIIYGGPDKVLNIALGPKGGLAYLTDSKSSNLNFNNQKYSAGINKILNFWFNGKGDLIYRDQEGRRWNNGRQTGR